MNIKYIHCKKYKYIILDIKILLNLYILVFSVHKVAAEIITNYNFKVTYLKNYTCK